MTARITACNFLEKPQNRTPNNQDQVEYLRENAQLSTEFVSFVALLLELRHEGFTFTNPDDIVTAAASRVGGSPMFVELALSGSDFSASLKVLTRADEVLTALR